MRTQGKRTQNDEWPEKIEVGMYWKDTKTIPTADSNLTKTCWFVVVPMSYGYAFGHLVNHTVREHEDDTISVKPGDGSSNSILVTGHHGEQWHGYIDRGVFYDA